jgi:small-conductance mechanosensitive channel
MEELQMENQALKQLSDTLSKRLHMWEVNAQSSSMALQQSLRAMHHHNTGSADHIPPALSGATSIAGPSMSESDPRVKELEDVVRRGEQELERIGRENDKLKNILGRYRDRWEKLKEGAKTRRESRVADGENGSGKKADAPVSPQLLDSDSPNRSEAEGNLKVDNHNA